MLVDYVLIVIFIVIVFFVGFILSMLPMYLAGYNDFINSEKVSSYECGFDSFDNNFFEFNIQFYLVSLLFMLFDVEIMFIYPWTLIISTTNWFEVFIMLVFLLLLTLGFCFEWLRGVLDWNDSKIIE
jgi:NADH-quinone oxidoreductase subunit A